jgi:hypothetical protein
LFKAREASIFNLCNQTLATAISKGVNEGLSSRRGKIRRGKNGFDEAIEALELERHNETFRLQHYKY